MLRLVIAFVAAVISFSGGEFYARARWPESKTQRIELERLTATGVPEIPYVYAPSPRFTNSLGLRNVRDVARVKAPGTVRVLVIGDSTTAAENVELDELYTTLMETDLNERFEKPVQVLNLSVPGLSLRQEVALYRYKGRALEPDLVVFAACVNDAIDRAFDGSSGVRRSRSRLITLLRVWRSATFTERVSLEHWWSVDDPVTQRLRPSLQEMAGIGTDVPVLLTMFPVLGVDRFFGHRAEDFLAKQPHLVVLGQFSREYGVPYVELFPSFDEELLRTYRREDDPTDVTHFGVSGHIAVATALVPRVEAILREQGHQ